MSYRDELAALEAAGLRRSPVTVEGDVGAHVQIGGHSLINLCSNNYLGLANHPRLKRESARASWELGVGSGASRLVSGTLQIHLELEAALARFKGTEGALLFNSGYQCNTGVIPALMRADDLIFSDEFNHASLIDGCRLARAEVQVYRHNDIDHLKMLLREARQVSPAGRWLMIVTEGLFSMEGDICPLPDLLSLADCYGASLYIDEAHANGTLGSTGRGILEHFRLDAGQLTAGERVILIGTLGKAFGSFGAFVAGSRVLVDYLLNRCRTFIYTTALPPATVAASLEALRLVTEESWRFNNLEERVRQMAKGLEPIAGHRSVTTPIFFLVVGDPRQAVGLSAQLMEEGYFVQAIRPPTVPEGTSRLRITVTSAHTSEEISRFGRVLQRLRVGGLRYSAAA